MPLLLTQSSVDRNAPAQVAVCTVDEGAYDVASVLREDALYKQKQQKEAAQIEKYESELRDCTEFYAWQSEMKTKDLAIRKEQVERVDHHPVMRDAAVAGGGVLRERTGG